MQMLKSIQIDILIIFEESNKIINKFNSIEETIYTVNSNKIIHLCNTKIENKIQTDKILTKEEKKLALMRIKNNLDNRIALKIFISC